MNEIFTVFAPATVTKMMDELFTGYINSPMCSVDGLGEIYELKRMIDVEANKAIATESHGQA